MCKVRFVSTLDGGGYAECMVIVSFPCMNRICHESIIPAGTTYEVQLNRKYYHEVTSPFTYNRHHSVLALETLQALFA